MVVVDPRKVIGCRISAKACHVLSDGHCRRRYGILSKEKVLYGHVTDVLLIAKEGGTGQRTTYVVGSFDLGDCFKTKQLPLTLVKDNTQGEVAADAAAPTTTNPTTIATIATIATNTTIPPTTPTIGITTIPTINNTPPVLAHQTTPQSAATFPAVASPGPTATAHDENWFVDNIATAVDINGVVPSRQWGVQNAMNEVFHEGSHRGNNINLLSRLDVFYLMFPPDAVRIILRETNNQLLLKNSDATLLTRQELLKLFGVLILITRYEFASRDDLWSHLITI
jgi:Transposase IS4